MAESCSDTEAAQIQSRGAYDDVLLVTATIDLMTSSLIGSEEMSAPAVIATSIRATCTTALVSALSFLPSIAIAEGYGSSHSLASLVFLALRAALCP